MSNLPNWPIFLTVPEHLSKQITGVFVCGSQGNELLLVADSTEKNGEKSGVDIYHGKGGNFDKVLNLDDDKVADIVVSTTQTFLLLTQNKKSLYAWGNNHQGAVGNGQKGNNVETPFLVSSNEDSQLKDEIVVQIAAGYDHSVCLTGSGRVYLWGSNANFQVGAANAFTPTPMLHDTIKDRKIVRIACCIYTTLALDSDGQLFGWGYSAENYKVLGTATNSSVPVRIGGDSILEDVFIKDIACGPHFVLALTASGLIYSWGNNTHGQLGLAHKNPSDPVQITAFDSPRIRIDSVLASINKSTSVARSVSGDFYIWGQTRAGNLLSPTKVPADSLQAVFCDWSMHPFISPSFIAVENMQLLGRKTRSPAWLRKSFDDPETCDLKIVVEGRPIHVHKAILVARSEYFKNMLTEERWRESKSNVLEIADNSYEVYRTLLYYLYTNDAELLAEMSQEDAVSLYHLANCCFEEELKRQVCLFVLRKWFNLESVISLYAMACDHEMEGIAAACIELILENLSNLIKSADFDQLKPEYAKTILKLSADRNLLKS